MFQHKVYKAASILSIPRTFFKFHKVYLCFISLSSLIECISNYKVEQALSNLSKFIKLISPALYYRCTQGITLSGVSALHVHHQPAAHGTVSIAGETGDPAVPSPHRCLKPRKHQHASLLDAKMSHVRNVCSSHGKIKFLLRSQRSS